jgi:hypothetical protein
MVKLRRDCKLNWLLFILEPDEVLKYLNEEYFFTVKF